uniref:Uncharacterized protein n=1 Tax=Arundo donax TaxID=35708 RepID=A0A0A9HR41_ARUDO
MKEIYVSSWTNICCQQFKKDGAIRS